MNFVRRTGIYPSRAGIVANNRPVISIALTVFGLLAAITCILVAGHTGRWGDIRSALIMFVAYAVSVVIVVFLGSRAFSRSRRFLWIAGALGACAALALAQLASSVVAQRTRETELRRAIGAGLEMDCRTVFDTYRSRPEFERDGFVRVFYTADEFDALPRSIRMLNPVYITVEDHPFGTDMPANIGLCTNGFGGFAFGVRVFMDAQNRSRAYWCKAVSPTIFIWQEET